MVEKSHILLDKTECLVIGGSAGSFEPIFELITNLPENLGIPVIVVIHRGKDFKSNLKQLFQSRSSVKVKEADEKEKLLPGIIYLAPVNFHLLIEPDRSLSIDASEPVLFCRPSIDVTFISAADVFGENLVAMLFSGANNDGANGCAYVERSGGKVLIQDPESAEVDTMPRAGVNKVKQAVLFKSKHIAGIIEQLPLLTGN